MKKTYNKFEVCKFIIISIRDNLTKTFIFFEEKIWIKQFTSNTATLMQFNVYCGLTLKSWTISGHVRSKEVSLKHFSMSTSIRLSRSSEIDCRVCLSKNSISPSIFITVAEFSLYSRKYTIHIINISVMYTSKDLKNFTCFPDAN